jgi:hypothetical protein
MLPPVVPPDVLMLPPVATVVPAELVAPPVVVVPPDVLMLPGPPPPHPAAPAMATNMDNWANFTTTERTWFDMGSPVARYTEARVAV